MRNELGRRRHTPTGLSEGGPPPDGQPLYRQVHARLEEMAVSLPLDGDGLLPPEPDLVARFGVSRGTLRRAVDELARAGLLRVEPGRGTYVDQATKVRWLVWERLRAVARPDARFDLDVSRFVPDFEGRERCDEAITSSAAFTGAATVFCAPDNSLTALRTAALAAGKRLVVATFGLRRDLVLVDGARTSATDVRLAGTLDGMELVGERLDLDGLAGLGTVDAVFTGAVAVTRQGLHFGGGQGYLDIEWGLLRHLGLVDERTPVVASVHDCQVIDVAVAPAAHDAVVDRIVCPSGAVVCDPPLPKPTGLLWGQVPAELALSCTYLASLRRRDGR